MPDQLNTPGGESYTSAECQMGQCRDCRHGEVPRNRDGVTHFPCSHACHEAERARARAGAGQ